jgi:hypothetical protein
VVVHEPKDQLSLDITPSASGRKSRSAVASVWFVRGVAAEFNWRPGVGWGAAAFDSAHPGYTPPKLQDPGSRLIPHSPRSSERKNVCVCRCMKGPGRWPGALSLIV